MIKWLTVYQEFFVIISPLTFYKSFTIFFHRDPEARQTLYLGKFLKRSYLPSTFLSARVELSCDGGEPV